MRTTRTAGFTVLELVIAIAILGLVMGSLTNVLDSTGKTYNQGSASARVQADARRALDRIAMELENCGLGTLIPAPINVACTNLMFQKVTGVNSANNDIVFGTSTRLQLLREPSELDNGVDDDGDGLVDEGRVVLTRNVGAANEVSASLVCGVSELLQGELPNAADDNGNGLDDEPGFCMTLQGSLLILRLTLARPVGGGRTVSATVESAVRIKD